jgi:hypothetical protein
MMNLSPYSKATANKIGFLDGNFAEVSTKGGQVKLSQKWY